VVGLIDRLVLKKLVARAPSQTDPRPGGIGICLVFVATRQKMKRRGHPECHHASQQAKVPENPGHGVLILQALQRVDLI
jgi:hypothetical protein